MQKFVQLCTAIVIMATMLTGYATEAIASALPFRDIQNSFAKSQIVDLNKRGIVGGDGNGYFRPTAPITRAEFATMLLKSKAIPAPAAESYQGTFRDVPRGEWFAPFAEASYRLGVTSGKAPGLFQPSDNLTREEMVKMTVNALGRESESARKMSYGAYSTAINKYADRGTISSWAVKPLAYAIQEGMLSGRTANEIKPQDLATREEVVAFLSRSLVPHPKGNNLIPVSRGNLPFFNKQGAEATAYTHSGALSAIGLQVREGLVAVDPAQIPLGSHLYIPGYGYGIAGDTGGDIKAARVDLFKNSYNAAIQFGRQDVDIFVID
ncbi:S-layer homology domain-containing protein [Tumebacillus permanentifrigoris]|uniref:3D (Asp-Asp-Asp) domain-containing protein n=1 Tax=Tumebacillus permanentifrigoris TaxID=378543 RepID=A0A316DE99_9BACL|nr:S-layer homology domain-containing protein [Tumebacillus permanentifrigoris]PWK15968.1 3D (Asp-Asp-Asp) domain-containing protein [Tumebacillus permanentifrigoris]